MSVTPVRGAPQYERTAVSPPTRTLRHQTEPNHPMSSVEGNRHFLPLGKRDARTAEIYRKFKLYDCGPGNPATPELVPYSAGGKYPRAPPSAYPYATTLRVQNIPTIGDACKMLEAVLLRFEGWLDVRVELPIRLKSNNTYSRDPYVNNAYQALSVVEKREFEHFTDYVILHHWPLTQLHKFAGSRRTDLPILMDKEGFWCATDDSQWETMNQYVGPLSPPKEGNVITARRMYQHDRHYLTGRLPSNLLNVEVVSSPNHVQVLN